jgi:hypothetical protein
MQTRPVQISIESIIAQNGQLLLTGDFTNYWEQARGQLVKWRFFVNCEPVSELLTNREWEKGTDKMCRLAKSRALLPQPLDVQRLLTFDKLGSCRVPPGVSSTAGTSLRML